MTEIRLTKEQKKQIAKLEAATGAVAVFRFAPLSLCLSLENRDGLALYYRSAKTLAEIIASGELRQYPDPVQRELMRVRLSGKERKKKCCNMLPSSVYGDTPDTILADAMSEAELLKFGWQLSFDDDFCNPFVRCRKTKTEHIPHGVLAIDRKVGPSNETAK